MIANICKTKGIAVEKVPSGGGSDSNVFNRNGINAINLGAGIEFAHTTDERLCINDFLTVAEVALEIMIR